jgi:hypothetical protein
MTQITAVETEPVVADWKQIGEQIVICLSERVFDRLGNRPPAGHPNTDISERHNKP